MTITHHVEQLTPAEAKETEKVLTASLVDYDQNDPGRELILSVIEKLQKVKADKLVFDHLAEQT